MTPKEYNEKLLEVVKKIMEHCHVKEYAEDNKSRAYNDISQEMLIVIKMLQTEEQLESVHTSEKIINYIESLHREYDKFISEDATLIKMFMIIEGLAYAFSLREKVVLNEEDIEFLR